MKTNTVSALLWGVVIGLLLSVACGLAKGAEETPVVNVNTATIQELSFLPGVGEVIASRIVEMRKADDLAALEHLLYVKGIGEKTLAQIAPFVVFDGPTTATAPIPASKPILD